MSDKNLQKKVVDSADTTPCSIHVVIMPEGTYVHTLCMFQAITQGMEEDYAA